MNFPSDILNRIRQSHHLVIFTGSGVSQESGIPTFRDAMTGLWEAFDPNELATPEAFAKQRDVVWGWYEFRRAQIMRCQPNPAHCAITELVQHLPKVTIITQNVDDLHERAGCENVIHLHGSISRPRCRACSRPHPLPPDISDMPPRGERLMPPKCGHCGGWIRPGVVWFGEDLPSDDWRRAKDAIRTCDALFCIGTSAVVFPAAILPFEAAERNATIVQINPHVTELDRIASLNIHSMAGVCLPKLVRAICGD